MTSRVPLILIGGIFLTASSGLAQTGQAPAGAARYIDAVNGLSLEQAIARALEQEPSLRAARYDIDAAAGLRVDAGLRPNPSVSFERRDEPGGTDVQASVSVEWPLDLFRRRGRVAVADRTEEAVKFAVSDKERLLAAEVRRRYGDVVAAVRELTTLDELVASASRQLALLRSRVDQGATPPLERDLVDVELRRFESDRTLQAGRAEGAFMELKRVLGMPADAPLTLRDTLEDVVGRELSPGGEGTDAAGTVLQPRADVLEAQARIAVADARIESARREGRFDVNLFGSYMRMDAGFPQLGFSTVGHLERVRARFNYVAVGANVTIPLLDRNQGQVAAARAERAGAAAAYEAVRLSAAAEAAAARTRDEHAREAVRLYTGGARTLARQNLDVVAQSYALGRMTVFDVLAEQRRYLDLERAYTEALTAAYEARTALVRALGDWR